MAIVSGESGASRGGKRGSSSSSFSSACSSVGCDGTGFTIDATAGGADPSGGTVRFDGEVHVWHTSEDAVSLSS